jgi:hypothetical protein
MKKMPPAGVCPGSNAKTIKQDAPPLAEPADAV